jgi:NADH:ubiquinone oxidoreductase subunit H
MITSSLSLVHLVMQQQNISNLLVFPGYESETELIAGFHVELAGVGFTLFFLAEYSNIMTAAIFTILLFLGGFGVFESYDCYVKPVISVLFFMMIYRSLIHLVNNFHSNTPFNHSSR